MSRHRRPRCKVQHNGLAAAVMEQRIRRAWELRIAWPTATIEQIRLQLVTEELHDPDGSLSARQVTQALSKAEDRLAARFYDNALPVKLEQTERLNRITEVALAAFERSTQPIETVTTVEGRVRRANAQLANPSASDDAPNLPEGLQQLPEQVTRTVAQQNGQPGFLQAAMSAQADVRKIWGLDAPRRTDVTSGNQPVKAYVGVDLDKV